MRNLYLDRHAVLGADGVMCNVALPTFGIALVYQLIFPLLPNNVVVLSAAYLGVAGLIAVALWNLGFV